MKKSTFFGILTIALCIGAALGIALGVGMEAARAQKAGVNYLTFRDHPPAVSFMVYEEGEFKERGRIVFPSRQHAVRTGESIMNRFATKAETEYFCTWALHEEEQ